MIPINHDSPTTGEQRRRALYAGELYIDSPTEPARRLCAFADELARDAFGALDPETAQYRMEVVDYAALLAELKPRFIHHRRSRELVRDILAAEGRDLANTYFDVPRLRTSTSDGYLTSGIAFAWHPHRDTWYSAPQAQINYWMPVYDVEPDNAMAFHLEYFDTAVPNNSETYNYYEWNQKYRRSAAGQIGADTRPLPSPTRDIDVANALVPVTPVGGLTVFSGQHLHSSVPNVSGKTRFSIDFRVLDTDDIRAGLGADNVDSRCTGSSIRDFLCAADFSPMPDEIVHLFDDGTEGRGELLYSENAADRINTTT